MKTDRAFLVKNIKEISTQIDKEYSDVLLSNRSIELLEKFFQNNSSEDLRDFGKYCAIEEIPYLELNFIVEDLFQRAGINYNEFIDNIALGYLRIKLQNDAKYFEIKVQKIFAPTINKVRDTINSHIYWILEFISSITNDTDPPQMDETRCHLGCWIEKMDEEYDIKEIKEQHHNLHTLAKHAYISYRKGAYHRFLLLYIDMIYYSAIIRQNILQYFTEEELISFTIDALTHLPNRFTLQSDIKNLDSSLSFFLFNIKDFSKINLMFGQKTGDKVIKSIAQVLVGCKECQKVYRIYGDEFGILLKSEKVYESIQKIVSMLESQPYPKDSKLVNITIYGSYAKIGRHLLEKTEFGIIHGKQNSRKITNVDKFTRKEILSYAKNLRLSQRLQLAFASDKFYIYYQPIFNIDTGRIEKYEALLRVEDLNGRILCPSEFLDVLKNMFIYPEVTKMVLVKAFEKFKDKPYEFSVNLSFRDIVHEDTCRIIESIIKENPKTSRRFTIELLEYEAINNFSRVSEFIDRVRSYGVKISLDDFGAGYSNFVNIFKLKIDYIKIDGSIIQDILNDKKSKIIVKSIQNIAEEIGSKTIAEFVSSERIFEAVKLFGVNYAQGYFIGEPKADL